MENQAPNTTQTPTDSERRGPTRHRHCHFRRRRVLWALGLSWGVELDG